MTKNMNKAIALVTVGALSFAMMARTAVVAANNVSGYEKFKKSFFQMMEIDNGTTNTDIKLVLDGELVLASQTAEMKIEGAKHSIIGELDFLGEKQKMESYTNGKTSYNYDPMKNVYNSYQIISSNAHEPMTETQYKLVNAMTDVAVGDVKNHFVQNENQIEFSLNENQVPEVVQLILAVMYEQSSEFADMRRGEYGVTIRSQMHDTMKESGVTDEEYAKTEKQLNSIMEVFENNLENFNDPYVSSVYATATLDENEIFEKLSGSVTLVGKDEGGVTHKLEVFVDVVITDIGTTTVDAFDTTGKEIIDNSNAIIYEYEYSN